MNYIARNDEFSFLTIYAFPLELQEGEVFNFNIWSASSGIATVECNIVLVLQSFIYVQYIYLSSALFLTDVQSLAYYHFYILIIY